MPTKRERVSRTLRPDIEPWLSARLNDWPLPAGSTGWAKWMYECALPDELLPEWRKYGEGITRQWAQARPGTRPSLWWTFDSPEPRQRLAGRGTPCHERLAHAPLYSCGLPVHWIGDDTISVYARLDMDLGVQRFAVNEPPAYESQSTYLRRLGLLLPGEGARLKPDGYLEHC